MKKKATLEAKSLFETTQQNKTGKTVLEHYNDSWDNVVSPNLNSFAEKEAILIGSNKDKISNERKSNVFDPRLATIVLERAARVMSQNPSGKSLAMSRDDKGKNMLMNLTMDKWVIPNANSQYSFLMKNRLWDMYSLMYGVFFQMVDYKMMDGYVCPDTFLLPIRSCRPQPNKFSLADSDWFGCSSWVGVDWLKSRNSKTWKNIDELILKMKDGGGSVKGDKSSDERTYIENQRQPSTVKDKAFKTVEIFTEYRKDRWITICPSFGESIVLRDIENPHGDDELPIVAKYAFPLMDSIYGLGEFERGKTLQYAINSLINLYLDGVKMSIFPPLILDADGIVASSIIQEPAAKWLVTKNGAIQQAQTNPQGIQTFQATYSFLVAALLNQAGTTDTAVSSNVDPGQGKTPQALQIVSNREASRDNWDRFMMEEALEESMKKLVNLTANGLEKEVEIRLFAKEIEQIQKVYPDVVDMMEGAERGSVKVSKKQFEKTKFDYEITKGSTYKADTDKELQNTQQIFDITTKYFDMISQSLAQKGKSIDMGELYQRLVIGSGTQDWDKIIVDIPPEQMATMQQQQQMQQGVEMQQGAQQIPQGIPQETQGVPQFQDPEVAEFAKKLFG